MKNCLTALLVLPLLISGCLAATLPDSEYAQFREPPLRTLETRSVIAVSGFDAAAVQEALNRAAQAGEPVKVLFAPGRYLLDAESSADDQDGHLFLNNATNVVIDFNGAELICRNPGLGFLRINNSENIIVRNGTVDYDPATHTEGWVRSIDPAEGTLEFELRDGFPSPLAPHFKEAAYSWWCLMDREVPGRLKAGARNFYRHEAIEPLGKNRFRVRMKIGFSKDWKMFEEGDRFTLLARHRGPFLFADHCRQVTAMDLTSYNIPGVQYESRMTEALNVIRCKALIKPGAWKGGNADGVHCKSNRIGPWVEDCIFEGISDDTLVVFARPFSVMEKLSNRRFKICRLLYQDGHEAPFKNEVAAGDVVDIFNPVLGTVFATAEVVSYDPAQQILELDRELPGLDPGIGKDKSQIWNRSMGRGFVLKGNIIRNSRRYGIYMKGSNGLIENNTLFGLSSCAITLQNEPSAPNGPFCHDVIIRNNTISDCGFEYGYSQDPDVAALRVFSKRLDRKPVTAGTVHSNIRIENNRFVNPQEYAVRISNTKNAAVVSNRFECAEEPEATLDSLICVRSSDDVFVEDNVLVQRAEETDYTKYRPLPLRELATVRTLSVADFGALPDDEADDRVAIQKALNAAADSNVPSKLFFEAGQYILGRDGDQPIRYMSLLNATNLVVDFNHSVFRCENPLVPFFRIDQSENIIVKDGTVDYDPAPHTEGWIRALDPENSTIDFEVRDGFPLPDSAPFKLASNRFGYQLDPKISGRLKSDIRNFYYYREVTAISENLFRVQLKSVPSKYWKTLEAGDRFVLLARGGGPLLFAVQSRQVSAIGLTSYCTPGGHYLSQMTEALNVINCRALIKDGFWKGGNADGVHCQSSRVGPWVENCIFEGISDDTLVIYARPFAIKQQLSPSRFVICRLDSGGRQMELFEREVIPGDVLDFLNPNTGVILATAKVIGYNPETKTIAVDREISGLDIGTDIRNTQIWNRSMGSGFVLKDNIIRNSRRYGVYLKGSNGLIENNTFIGLSSSAMTLQNEPSAPNGPFCHQVVIRGNTVSECGFEQYYLQTPASAALSIFSKKLNNLPAVGVQTHSDIRIENNTFQDPRNHGLFICNADAVSVISNRFEKTERCLGEIESAVWVQSSRNVVLDGNLIDNELLQPGCEPVVHKNGMDDL